MTKLKDVRLELARMQKELKAKEAELRRETAVPLADIFRDAILKDEDACARLSEYSRNEIRVIAKNFVQNIDRIIAESESEIEAVRVKKAERAEKRKASEKTASRRMNTQNNYSEEDEEAARRQELIERLRNIHDENLVLDENGEPIFYNGMPVR